MLPVLLLILLVVIDFGHLFLGWVNLQNTARIGADFAATHSGAWTASDQDAIDAQERYQELIKRDASTINCSLPSTLPIPTFPDGNTTLNGRAQVNLTCDFQLLTPLVGNVVGNPLRMSASAAFPIRVGLYGVAPPSTPMPTATPAPTPTPTAKLCTVPTLIGKKTNPASQDWAKAGFDPVNFLVSIGANNYTIRTEVPLFSDGTEQYCATFQITVGP
jgi:Flp pilus assembly protein TadG